MRKGIGVSPGVAVGTAYCINEIFVSADTKRLNDTEVQAELVRFDHARTATAADLHALSQKVTTQVGPQEAAIFRVHESILLDPTLTAKIRGWIVDDRATAPVAPRPPVGRIHGSVFADYRRISEGAAGRRAGRDHSAEQPFDRRLAA